MQGLFAAYRRALSMVAGGTARRRLMGWLMIGFTTVITHCAENSCYPMIPLTVTIIQVTSLCKVMIFVHPNIVKGPLSYHHYEWDASINGGMTVPAGESE
jgi:hypothetical protein